MIFEIVVAIIIAKLLTSKVIYCLPFHCAHCIYIYIKRFIEIKKYKSFLKDFSKLKTNKKQVLLLCHGRNHGYPLIENLNLNQFELKENECQFQTVDCNETVWPHIIGNVLDDSLFHKILKDMKFDYIFLFNCECHTMDINKDVTLVSKIRNSLKEDGILFVKDKRMKVLKSAGFKLIAKNYTLYIDFLPNYTTYWESMDYFTFPKYNCNAKQKYCTATLKKYKKCAIEEAELDILLLSGMFYIIFQFKIVIINSKKLTQNNYK